MGKKSKTYGSEYRYIGKHRKWDEVEGADEKGYNEQIKRSVFLFH